MPPRDSDDRDPAPNASVTSRERIDSLQDLNVLIVDAQTTGANPARGALLELGWTSTSAGHTGPIDALPIESHVVALPADHDVPANVLRLTGITRKEIASARSREEVWRRIEAAARCTHATVVHFARFERPFLRQLHLEQARPGYGSVRTERPTTARR
ncbi:MAG: hypothetical protein B7733_00270, partial [Myxococcales bacterium FL481]